MRIGIRRAGRVFARGLAVLFFMVTCSGLPSLAQTGFPDKTVKLIVPFPPGGSTDLIGRSLAQQLSQLWGQQVVVDNRPGAGGSIGADAVAKAAPDGYTLLLGHTGTLSINPLLYPNLPYDPVKSFAPVSLVTFLPLIFVTNTAFEPRSVTDLVAYVKANPGTVNYASAGNGSANHLAMEYFKLRTQTDIVHVPYKGTGQAIVDLLGERVSMLMAGGGPLMSHIRAGKLRALAVASNERLEMLPDVPTMAQAGLPDFDPSPWFGILAPAGTPPEIVAKLSRDIATVMQRSEAQRALASEGAVIVTNTPEQFAVLIQADLVRWESVVKATGMKIE